MDTSFREEKMISLKSISNRIICDCSYYNQGITNAINDCYVRQTVAQKLISAINALPENYSFLIFDTWRPYDVQKALYDEFSDNMRRMPKYANLSEKAFKAELHKFVSNPIINKDKPFVHSTGGAVDLTLLKDGIELDMGTCFDETSEKAYTNYFDNKKDFLEIKRNRHILLDIMKSVGFTNFESEWWHFDYGDMFWADKKQTTQIYSGIFNTKELEKYL